MLPNFTEPLTTHLPASAAPHAHSAAFRGSIDWAWKRLSICFGVVIVFAYQPALYKEF